MQHESRLAAAPSSRTGLKGRSDRRAGSGAGTLTLKPEGGTPVETDTEMATGAAGARGVLAEAPADDGFELAAKSGGLLLRISSDDARDGAGGRLAAADTNVTRHRLGLEGSWRGIETEGGGTLMPTQEAGLRHDGGDAETGFGVEAGAGLAWSDPARGIRAELKARGLLAHEADGFASAAYRVRSPGIRRRARTAARR